MELSKKLNDLLNKEIGGRHGGKGHEFQRYWAIHHLLDTDSQKADYLLLFEYIEDIATLDSEIDPKTIELYQIKKKEGKPNKWTISKLKDRKEGKSIIAKLLESRLTLADETKSVTFVSNAPVEFNTTDALAKKTLCFSELDQKIQEEIREQVALEIGQSINIKEFNQIFFTRSSLSIDDLENHITGIIVRYLAEKFPNHTARADVLCKSLYQEVKSKFTSTEDSGDFDNLKKVRGISRNQFQSMLTLTLSKKPDDSILDDIQKTLIDERVPFIKRQRIKEVGRQYIIEKSGKSRNAIEILHHEIEKITPHIPVDIITAWDVANWMKDQLKTKPSIKDIPLTDEYLIVASLFKLNT